MPTPKPAALRSGAELVWRRTPPARATYSRSSAYPRIREQLLYCPANKVGRERGWTFSGAARSSVTWANPRRADQESEALLVADLDREQVRQARINFRADSPPPKPLLAIAGARSCLIGRQALVGQSTISAPPGGPCRADCEGRGRPASPIQRADRRETVVGSHAGPDVRSRSERLRSRRLSGTRPPHLFSALVHGKLGLGGRIIRGRYANETTRPCRLRGRKRHGDLVRLCRADPRRQPLQDAAHRSKRRDRRPLPKSTCPGIRVRSRRTHQHLEKR